MKGRLPNPSNVVEMRGNPGKRPINHDEPAPTPIEGIPEPPRKLKVEAKREWDRIIDFVVNSARCGQESLSILCTYCNLHAAIVETEKKGEVPMAALLTQYRGLAAEFGLMPASRTRIKADGKKEDSDEKRFFG